jgi:DNA-binding transcriptional LysR family regulator
MEARSASVLLSRLSARTRLRHLQLFVKLTELGNLKRSAEALHMSQPTATQLLADLERLVEIPLFDRHARGVRITAAGQALAPAARRVLDAMADASESLNAIQRQSESVVRVAAITGAISGWLVRALPSLAQEQPTIQVQVQECDADRCGELVARREVDLALCREPAVLPAGCAFQPRLADSFVVACGLAHPLARRKHVAWSTLARERWLLPPVQSAARRAFDERMAALGAEPKTSPVVTRVSALTWAMLQGDRLVTLIPHGVVRQLVEAGQLALIDAQPPLSFSPLGWLLPLKDVSQATQRVIDHLDRFARPPA